MQAQQMMQKMKVSHCTDSSHHSGAGMMSHEGSWNSHPSGQSGNPTSYEEPI